MVVKMVVLAAVLGPVPGVCFAIIERRRRVRGELCCGLVSVTGAVTKFHHQNDAKYHSPTSAA